MKYSRKALLEAIQTRLGTDYMRAWDELKFCAIPELCAKYSTLGFVFLESFNSSEQEYCFSQRMADYVVALAMKEIAEVGYLTFGKQDSYID